MQLFRQDASVYLMLELSCFYVQRKMRQQEKNAARCDDDNKIKVPNAVLSALAGKTKEIP